MKGLFFLFAITAAIFCTAFLPASRPVHLPVNAPAIPVWTVSRLTQYIRDCDHPLIVNFWSMNCAPCIKEIPYLQAAAAEYRDSGVELLLVNLDPPARYPDQVVAFARNNGYSPPLIWLDRRGMTHYTGLVDSGWTGGMPSSLFINHRTNYRQFFDRQLTDRQVKPAIRRLIAG